MWTEKYRPQTIEEVIGNEDAKRALIEWIVERRRGKSKTMGVFLVGPPGTGKTTLIHVVAKQLRFHVLELNASDVRTAGKLHEALNRVSRAKPLDLYLEDGRFEIMVFLDEVDGIYGNADRGGLKTLLKLAEKRAMFLVLSANFPDPKKHKDLLKGFKVIRFWPLKIRQMVMLLKRISREENLSLGDETLEDIAVKSGGDARIAINKLQIRVMGPSSVVEEEVLQTLPLEETLNKILGGGDEDKIFELISSSLASPEDIYKALAETVATSRSINLETRCRVLDVLSKIDVLMGRIRRTGEWKMLKELMYMLSSLASTLEGTGLTYTSGIPTYVFMRFIKVRKRERIDEIERKIGRRQHLSRRKALFEILPFLSLDVKRGRADLVKGLGLDSEDEKILAEVAL